MDIEARKCRQYFGRTEVEEQRIPPRKTSDDLSRLPDGECGKNEYALQIVKNQTQTFEQVIAQHELG